MRICVFEDARAGLLEPLTLTRPAFDLLCGAHSLLQRQKEFFSATEAGALVRPSLVEITKAHHPDLAVGDGAWMRSGVQALVNARWLPPHEKLSDPTTSHIALIGEQVAYVLPPKGVGECTLSEIPGRLQRWKKSLPSMKAGGHLIDYPWDLIQHNHDMLCRDFSVGGRGFWALDHVAVVGPRDRLIVDPSASIEPCVVVDTTRGAVVLGREVRVQSFSRLQGPCYIGDKSWVVGGKVAGSTIGPICRVGGEVEASILHGYSNKYHEGFLGHSYVGEWVNLAAGTQTSDLRVDYGVVKMPVAGRKVSTGMTKVGSFIGDHTKTGLNTLLNTGTSAGVFCQLLPSASLLPRLVPSFCTIVHGQVQERRDLREAFATAAVVMNRRDCAWTTAHADLFQALFDATAEQRRQV